MKKVIYPQKFVLFVIGLLHGEKVGKNWENVKYCSKRWEVSLIWFRNDLRINDHPGINSALSISGKVIDFIVLIHQCLK